MLPISLEGGRRKLLVLHLVLVSGEVTLTSEIRAPLNLVSKAVTKLFIGLLLKGIGLLVTTGLKSKQKRK